MALDPIIIGSPNVTNFIFEAGSRITASASGIQECSVQALCARGASVFSLLPANGATFNSVFGTSYLPNTFLVDYSQGGPEVEYLEGQCARVTFSFKRPDPAKTGRTTATIALDSVINYDSPLGTSTTTVTSLGGSATVTTNNHVIGFPEPVVTVKYNSDSFPTIGGSFTSLYALPGSAKAQGFPTIGPITVPVTLPLEIGTTITYFDGSQFVTKGPITVPTVANFIISYTPNPLGWQLIRLKADPIAGAAFYDAEEEWRNFYFGGTANFVSSTPALP